MNTFNEKNSSQEFRSLNIGIKPKGYISGAELSIALRIKFSDLLNQLTNTNCQKIFKQLAYGVDFDLKDNNKNQGIYKTIINKKRMKLPNDFIFTPENVKAFFIDIEEIENFNFLNEYVYVEPDKYENKEKNTVLLTSYPFFSKDNIDNSKNISFNEIMSKMPQIFEYIKNIELLDNYEIVIRHELFLFH